MLLSRKKTLARLACLCFNLGGLGQEENLSEELGPIVYMAEEPESYLDEDEDSEMKSFFEHVTSRTGEILSQNVFASSERHISEVLTHIDLLEKTVRLQVPLVSIVTAGYRRN